MNRRLLRSFLRAYPFQPATALWRASEVAAISRVHFPDGFGLDLGCGDGRLTRILIDTVGQRRLVGLDVDSQETALAEQEQLYERIHTSAGSRIDEADASFDFVVSISVLEHIPEVEPVLTEVARVIRPGGKLLVTVPGIGFHGCLRGPWLFGKSRQRYLAELDRRVAHVRYWSAEKWRAALTSAGFRTVDVTPIMSCSVIRRWETISRMTAGALYLVTRGKAPIEIQRSMGLRKAGQHMPGWMAAPLARVLSIGVRDDAPEDESVAGCVLVVAERGA